MRLYVMRHGDAVPTSVDPTRPLSPPGLAEVKAMAEHLATRVEPVDQIWHSGKPRARQTAEIMAATLPGPCHLSQQPDLTPNDDPCAIASRINPQQHNDTAVMLVGHLPHVACLTGLLLAGQPDIGPIRFTTATVAALSWRDADGWAIDWCLRPHKLGD